MKIIIIVLVLLVTALNSVFIVTETELAIKFEFGKVVKTNYEPGLHFKIPFINNIRKFERRIMTVDIKPERYLTEEKKNVVVNSFIKWKIDDVAAYYRSMRGDEFNAIDRISKIVKDGLRAEFGQRTIHEVVSGQKHVPVKKTVQYDTENPDADLSSNTEKKQVESEQLAVAEVVEQTGDSSEKSTPDTLQEAEIDERNQIMNNITVNANKEVKQFGIRVVDVRIKRIDLTAKVSESVYLRMEAERKQIAKTLRAQGNKRAEEIEAGAERERTVILAKAYRTGEELRGQGDAESTDIYARAYGENREFFTLYRSLNAYKKAFSAGSDVLVLEPDSEFFRYFNQSGSAQ